MRQASRSTQGNIIRPHQYTTMQHMTGPSRKGPKRCIHCQKRFQKNEAWQRFTSPQDRKYGTYAYGIHATCQSQHATA